MGVRISLSNEGLFDKRRLLSWTNKTRKTMRNATVRAMRRVGPIIVDSVRFDMIRELNINSKSFLKSMRFKVFDKKPEKFPSLYIGSKIPWLGIHEKGGVISGRMLIPLLENKRRVGRKEFKKIINSLINSGNSFFIKKNDKIILMAENIRENDKVLLKFKQVERLRSGQKKLHRGQAIPVALFVKRVRLESKFNIKLAVRRELPKLAKAIHLEVR